jgi:tetratricopeptide (TPR) repeat protein
MARRLSPRRSFVFVLLIAPSIAARGQASWDTNVSDGVKAFGAGQYAQSVVPLTAALEQARMFPQPDIRRAQSAHLLGLAYLFQIHADTAEGLFAEAKASAEAVGPSARHLLGMILDAWGQLRAEQGRWKEAEELLRPSHEFCRETRGERDPCSVSALRHLGELAAVQGRMDEAETKLQHAIDLIRRSPDSNGQLAAALRGLSTVYTFQRRYELAEPLLQEAVAAVKPLGDTHPALADGVMLLGQLYRLEREFARAEPLLKKSAHIYEATNDPHLAGTLDELGFLAIEQGKYATAQDYFHRAVAMRETMLGAGHPLVARSKTGLAQAYYAERNYVAAKSCIAQAVAIQREFFGDANPEIASMLVFAANIDQKQRLLSEADAHYREALDIFRRSVASGNPERVAAEHEYARFSKSFRK